MRHSLALEHCRKIKFSEYVHQTPTYTNYIELELIRLSDFVSCSKFFFIFGVGVYTSALNHCRKIKFRIQLHLTLINIEEYLRI